MNKCMWSAVGMILEGKNGSTRIKLGVVHRVLVGKSEGKRSLGRPRRRWEDNIKMDLQGSGRELWGLDGVGSG